MQGLKVAVFLAVVVVLFGFVSAGAVPSSDAVAEPLAGAAVEQKPAAMVRAQDHVTRSCTNSACATLCRALGWIYGFCLDADWCLCYN